jgi:hypothetical protein
MYDVHLPAQTTRAESIVVGRTLALELAQLVEGELATQLREGGVNWAPLAPATMAKKQRNAFPTPEKAGYGTGRLANAAAAMPITLVEDDEEVIVIEAYLTPQRGSLQQAGAEDFAFQDQPGSDSQFAGALHDFLEGREPKGKRKGSQPARPLVVTSRLEQEANQMVQGASLLRLNDEGFI